MDVKEEGECLGGRSDRCKAGDWDAGVNGCSYPRNRRLSGLAARGLRVLGVISGRELEGQSWRAEHSALVWKADVTLKEEQKWP